MTLIGCFGHVADVENRYLSALEEVETFKTTSERLVLTLTGDEVRSR